MVGNSADDPAEQVSRPLVDRRRMLQASAGAPGFGHHPGRRVPHLTAEKLRLGRAGRRVRQGSRRSLQAGGGPQLAVRGLERTEPRLLVRHRAAVLPAVPGRCRGDQERGRVDPDPGARPPTGRACPTSKGSSNSSRTTTSPLISCPRTVTRIHVSRAARRDGHLRPDRRRHTRGLPYYVSETGCSYLNIPGQEDTSYAAAFWLKAVAECDGITDILSLWCFSDIFEKGRQAANMFYGGYGALAMYGPPSRSTGLIAQSAPSQLRQQMNDRSSYTC